MASTHPTKQAKGWHLSIMDAPLSTLPSSSSAAPAPTAPPPVINPTPVVALPSLPHALLYEVCAYLWPGDVARLANAARGLGAAQDENGTNLVTHGLSFFRPSKPLPVAVVEDLIMHRLPFCKALRVLDLSSAELTPQIILSLGRLAAEEGRFQTVRSLNFFANHLGNEGCLALAQALEQGGFRAGLQGFYVRANQIRGDDYGGSAGGGGGDHIAALCQVLKAGACSAPLTSFSLAQNKLGATAALHVGSALATFPLKKMRKLDLHLNQFGDRGAISVMEGLAGGGGMPCLDELYLGFNGIGDAGARAVADCLVHMPVLRELDLACNVIGNGGALALAVRLSVDGGRRTTTTTTTITITTATLLLETLDLRGNRIGDDGACALRDFLAAATTEGGSEREEANGGEGGEGRGGCPNLANIFLDDNRAIRARGREALQALQAARGIVCMEGPDW